MMIALTVAVVVLFILVLLQYRTLSKQNIKIEQMDDLANTVSDQVDDVEFVLETLEEKVDKLVAKKSNKKKGE